MKKVSQRNNPHKCITTNLIYSPNLIKSLLGGYKMKLSSVNGNWVADSREVAEMTDKQHGHLLRDVDGYVAILAESNFGVSDFFIESSYLDATGRTLRKYDCTRKGCDMIANKMTGEKGVLFTAAYVTKFEEMEAGIKTDINLLSPEMHMFKHMFDAVAKTQ